MIHGVRIALYGVLTEREGTDDQMWPGEKKKKKKTLDALV